MDGKWLWSGRDEPRILRISSDRNACYSEEARMQDIFCGMGKMKWYHGIMSRLLKEDGTFLFYGDPFAIPCKTES